MNTIGIQIRKIDINDNGKKYNPTTSNLHNQVRTLHRKLKKNDEELKTIYVIEKDNPRKFHIHLLLYYKDEYNLYNQLSRFIGGNSWNKKKDSSNLITECIGKFGEIDLHHIYNEDEFICRYMNKYEQSKSLI